MSRYDDRPPIIPADDALVRLQPWYRSAWGLVAICLIGVLLLGFALFAAMEVGADQSCADIGGQRMDRVCTTATDVVVVDPNPDVVPVPVTSPVVVPSPVFVSPGPGYISPEENVCIQQGGTWDGAVCLP